MPRRLITQPPLLPEAGWESQQVLRVRVWTHVTQTCARCPAAIRFPASWGMGRLGLGKRLCVFAVVCVVEPTSFSQIFPKAPAPDAATLQTNTRCVGGRRSAECEHTGEHTARARISEAFACLPP